MSSRPISWRWIRNSGLANSRRPSAIVMIAVPITATPTSVGVSRRTTSAMDAKRMAIRKY
jgi:hypothetical protein